MFYLDVYIRPLYFRCGGLPIRLITSYARSRNPWQGLMTCIRMTFSSVIPSAPIFAEQIPTSNRGGNLMNHGEARRARHTTRHGLPGEQVLVGAVPPAKNAFSDARRSGSSRVATRESKRRPVNSHESLIAAYDPSATCLAPLRRSCLGAAAEVMYLLTAHASLNMLHSRRNVVVIRRIIVPRDQRTLYITPTLH